MATHSRADTRRRLPKQERRTQLLSVARRLIREVGTDEFSLGRLAERAGVTKPLVYDHFGDRAGVFAELYREFEAHQRETLTVALDAAKPDLPSAAALVAGAYIDCYLAEGRELADVVAALESSPTLSRVRHEAEDAYIALCRDTLETLTGPIDGASLHAVIGAGDALSRSVLEGQISARKARTTLTRVIIAVSAEDGLDLRKAES